MNVTLPSELRNGALSPEAADDKLEQIRDLLHGELRRDHDARLRALETRYKEFESDVQRRLELLQARLEALATENASERRTSFDELSRSIFELGDRIRRISHTE